MEEKSQENLDKGIDIAVSILKHEFPFITGWRYNDKGHYSRYTVYINLICDLEKTSEFYNSPIKKHYKNNGETDSPYPFFPLELSNEIDNNEKYELYTVMQKSFTEIYHEIPDEYRYLITDYISTDVVTPKEIYLEGFDFPAPDKLNESETNNDKVSLAKSLIQQLFDDVSFIEQSTYNDRPLLTVYFDSDDTAANIESFFTREICDTLRDYTGGGIKCNPSWGPEWRTNRNNPDILIDAILLKYDDEGNVLNENWYKVPSSDYNSLEKIINLTMKEKYDWWKDIKINRLNYIEMYEDVQIETELTVDEEWGAKQWREFFYVSEFPGNKGWEDNDDYARVSLGDIIDSWYAEVLREDLKDIFKYALNIKTHNFSFRNIYLIFE